MMIPTPRQRADDDPQGRVKRGLVLNGFNLLPLMPFDGGWVMHAVLFCRHPLLDLAFRLATVAALVGLGLLSGPIFFWIAGFMALGTPAAWHIANAAHRLRQQDAVAASLDDDTIPPATVRVILAELLAGKPNQTSPNILAQQVTSIFETLNARPPDVAASLGLLALHGGGISDDARHGRCASRRATNDGRGDEGAHFHIAVTRRSRCRFHAGNLKRASIEALAA